MKLGPAPFSALNALVRRHGRRVLENPALLPALGARLLRTVRRGELGSLLSRHAIQADLYADYSDWVARYDAHDAEARDRHASLAATLAGPTFSILMPTRHPPREHFIAALRSVRGQCYPRWELVVCDDGSTRGEVAEHLDAAQLPADRVSLRTHDRHRGIGAATQTALSAATGDWIVFLDHDDVLHPDALLALALALRDEPRLRFIYSDEDKLDTRGQRYWPAFKPDWTPDYLLSNNYITHLMACERSHALAVGGMGTGFDGAQDWDFALRATERLPDREIGHVPHVLYHWRSAPASTAGGIEAKPGVVQAQRRVLESAVERRGLEARVEQLPWAWRIRRASTERIATSIVLPTRDRPDLLERCLLGIDATTAAAACEVVIVDNGTSDAAALALLAQWRARDRVRVIEAPGAFNFSSLCNRAAAAASGDLLVFLNNDIEPRSAGWIEELQVQAMRPDVGAVGVRLDYPDGRLQHVGVFLGINGTAEHVFRGFPGDWTGINGRCQCVQQLSAVTGACIAIARAKFDAVGGFDEAFAISHNDLDLCLRLAEQGWKTLWTPHAVLCHLESSTLGYVHDASTRATIEREAALFNERWRAVVDRDPYYNVNLARTGAAFSLAFPPRDRREPFDANTA